MLMDFACRNIVITGASSDIGLAMARYLREKCDRRVFFASKSLVDSLSEESENSFQYLYGIDFTQEKDLQRLRNEVSNYFTEPFTVIHSVGDFWQHKPLVKTELKEVRRMFESHYLTLYGVAHALIPVMIKKGGGRIIAFSCNSVSYNYPDMAAFTSAKAAIECLIKCIANEYAEYEIVASALALPTIKTKKVLSEKSLENPENYITPEELAKIVLDTIDRMPVLVNGNIIKLFKFNRTFYHSGYFERNPRSIED